MNLRFWILAVVIGAYPCQVYSANILTPASETAGQLYATYLARDYFGLETQLAGLDPKDQRRGFFEGQLDAAFLRDGQAEEELRHFLELPGMEANWRKEAWLTLGTTQLRHGDYDAAARNLAHSLDEHSAQFTAAERVEVEENLALARALRGMPPQRRSDQEGASTVNATRGKSEAEFGGYVYITQVASYRWTQ